MKGKFLGLSVLGAMAAIVAWMMVLQPARATILLTPTWTSSPPPPTMCPQTTPELFYVDPVTSPTDLFWQTLTVHLGNGDAFTITAESGIFPGTTLQLLPDTAHHITVYGHVRPVNNNGCPYGNYTLSAQHDRYGTPLIIVQGNGSATPPPTFTQSLTPTPAPTLTPSPTVPAAGPYLPVILKSEPTAQIEDR